MPLVSRASAAIAAATNRAMTTSNAEPERIIVLAMIALRFERRLTWIGPLPQRARAAYYSVSAKSAVEFSRKARNVI
jgi:hypothetical protein